MEFITEHAGTIIVCILIITGIFFAVRKLIRDKRKDRSLCGDSCGTCPHAGTCHKDTTL